MNETVKFWVEIGSIFLMAGSIITTMLIWKRSQGKEIKFVMKMLFDVFKVLKNGKVNGEVEALEEEAIQFNIEN